MTDSNWILNLLIWGMLAIGMFFGLRARVRRARKEKKGDTTKTKKTEQCEQKGKSSEKVVNKD